MVHILLKNFFLSTIPLPPKKNQPKKPQINISCQNVFSKHDESFVKIVEYKKKRTGKRLKYYLTDLLASYSKNLPSGNFTTITQVRKYLCKELLINFSTYLLQRASNCTYLYNGRTNFILPCSLTKSRTLGMDSFHWALIHSLNHLYNVSWSVVKAYGLRNILSIWRINFPDEWKHQFYQIDLNLYFFIPI